MVQVEGQVLLQRAFDAVQDLLRLLFLLVLDLLLVLLCLVYLRGLLRAQPVLLGRRDQIQLLDNAVPQRLIDDSRYGEVVRLLEDLDHFLRVVPEMAIV